MGYINDQIDKNNMINYFNIFKTNMKMYKKYYIGLIEENNEKEGYNIINKKTGENYYWGNYEIKINKQNVNKIKICSEKLTTLSKKSNDINRNLKKLRINWKNKKLKISPKK